MNSTFSLAYESVTLDEHDYFQGTAKMCTILRKKQQHLIRPIGTTILVAKVATACGYLQAVEL